MQLFPSSVLRHASCLAALLPAALGPAAPIDESKLPPPAAGKIDFARDIRPIFEQSCLRCHGPEKPKSGFRLTSRADALKGGANGVDIIPGQSARSPLIHYVARLVEDMEMPPAGKGEALTTNQVGLLRAWIDQGVPWGDETAGPPRPSFELAPALGWISVNGDSAKFRAVEWKPDGWNGGAEIFRYREDLADGKSVWIEGRALRDDYKVTLDLRQRDESFTRFGFERFRKYYDDTGGYYAPFAPSAYDLGGDLHLDVGRAWGEFGVVRPDWPRLVFGYEYLFKDGDKSTLSWGPVIASSGEIRSIYPSVKRIDERTHVVRIDLSHDLYGYHIEDNLRAEFTELETRRVDAQLFAAGLAGPDLASVVREGQDQFQVANIFRVEKPLKEWWFVSGGYLFSWVDADASVALESRDSDGQPGPGYAWLSNEILLNQSTHVLNVNSQFQPWRTFTATAGAQSQWSWKEAFGDVSLDDVIDPSDPTTGIFRYPALLRADTDQAGVEENVLLRYAGIPFTALFAEARLKQEDLHLDQEETGPYSFLRDTDVSGRWQEYRAGFNVSPWRLVSFSSHYQWRRRETDHDNNRDEHPLGSPGEGYPAFIRSREIQGDEVEARLVLRPLHWLRAALSYQLLLADYRAATDPTDPALFGPVAAPGGRILAGDSDAHIYSASATLTPRRRLYLSSQFSYQDSTVTTADHGNDSVDPYDGDIYTVLASATYALGSATSLFSTYLFSRARYGQNNGAAGLPLGIDYDRHGVQVGLTRRLTAAISTRLQYGYFHYNEPTAGGRNDYTAHQVLGLLSVNWR